MWIGIPHISRAHLFCIFASLLFMILSLPILKDFIGHYIYLSKHDDIDSYSFDDDITRGTILQTLEKYNYLADPHTAVGGSGFNCFKKNYGANNNGIILATAHPGKFSDIIEPVINKQIELPQRLKSCLVKEKNSIKISNNYTELKSCLIDTK